MAKDDANETDVDFESVNKMADRLKLKGKERESYVHEHMTGLGYKPRTRYTKGDDDDDDKGGSRFGLGKRGSGNDDW